MASTALSKWQGKYETLAQRMKTLRQTASVTGSKHIAVAEGAGAALVLGKLEAAGKKYELFGLDTELVVSLTCLTGSILLKGDIATHLHNIGAGSLAVAAYKYGKSK